MNSTEILVHIPACQMQPWKYVLPLSGTQEAVDHGPDPMVAQEPFLKNPNPMLIAEQHVLTPEGFLKLKGIKQLEVLGTAVLNTIENNKDTLNYSILSGRLIHSEGTSIMVTGYESSGDNVIFATWDYGEPIEYVLARLSEAKRIVKFPLEVARAVLRRAILPELPAPQAVVSNVSGLDEVSPLTCLGGYGNNELGNISPIAIAAGTKKINIIIDHRVYNPPKMLLFVNQFLENLNQLIAIHAN